VLSNESERVAVSTKFAGLGGKLPPIGQRVSPVLLEPGAVVDVALKSEVVVARDARSGFAARTRKTINEMDGNELLKASHSSETEHRAFAPTKR